MDIIAKISSWALLIIAKTGYLGVFFLSALESMAIPIPSEVVVPFSGFLAVSGRFSFWLVVFIATLANYCGGAILYWIGTGGGRWLLERYGKYALVHFRDIQRMDGWYQKYGAKIVFWSRMLPLVRTYASLTAGVARMNFKRFSLYTLAGSFLWNLSLAWLGYKAGENWDALHKYFRQAEIVILVLIVSAVVWYVTRHLLRRKGQADI